MYAIKELIKVLKSGNDGNGNKKTTTKKTPVKRQELKTRDGQNWKFNSLYNIGNCGNNWKLLYIEEIGNWKQFPVSFFLKKYLTNFEPPACAYVGGRRFQFLTALPFFDRKFLENVRLWKFP